MTSTPTEQRQNAPPADLELHTLTFDELAVTPSIIERDIGYPKGGAPSDVADLIAETIDRAAELCRPRGGYRILGGIDVAKTRLSIAEGDSTLETGAIIASRLRKIDRLALFVCTVGDEICAWSRQLFAEGDSLKGYMVDTVASVSVERAMDRIQRSLTATMKSRGLGSTNRYSPGYCGWPVADQRKLFALLPGGFCGVTLTPSAMMQPLKSVSGIIGIGSGARRAAYPCKACKVESCILRNHEGGR